VTEVIFKALITKNFLKLDWDYSSSSRAYA
jgi:hypothetical protein